MQPPMIEIQQTEVTQIRFRRHVLKNSLQFNFQEIYPRRLEAPTMVWPLRQLPLLASEYC